MPAAVAEPPAVALSFANNFWGKDDAGVAPLLDRMVNAKQTCDELKAFYGARSSIEEEYSKKLLSLSKKALGSQESGTLKTSLDTVRAEIEAMGKQHQNIAAQIKIELEEPLAAFAGGMKERRKIVQNTVEKLHKTKTQQTQQVNKTRDKYEQECLKIKGYLAQGHMVMGQEERRNKAKLEKTQISLAASNTEYENAIKALEETTVRWNREWKAAADKFQDLEEERLDFTKSSLWTFANIASTVCVSDDSSCEKIRLSLENMDVETDIILFINEKGTSQEIPDAPKYINFCRGDINDGSSEASEDEHYSVAQFPRSINPAFRSSSPQPSTFESHHDPNSALANDLAHRTPVPTPTARDSSSSLHKSQQKPTHKSPQLARSSTDEQYRRGPPAAQSPSAYDAVQHSTAAHDPYSRDPAAAVQPSPLSERSSQPTSARPSSRDSHSEYSNPASYSSQEPPSGKASPSKQDPETSVGHEKRVLTKKSGFLQNHSPFKRKSIKDMQNPAPASRNTWHPSNSQGPANPQRRQQQYNGKGDAYGPGPDQTRHLLQDRTASPEPIDANASLALGVGHNVLPVTTPETHRRPAQTQRVEENDPIAAALAELKTGPVAKQSSIRMSADNYHGISPSAQDATMSRSFQGPGSHDMAATHRGTPPPSYQSQTQITRLGVPPPAVTSRAMKEATKKAASQARSVYGEGIRRDSVGSAASPMSRPGTRGNDGAQPSSPGPARSVSPQPQPRRMSNDPRRMDRGSVSPNSYNASGYHQRNLSQVSLSQPQGYYRQASPHGSARGSTRGVSPSPYRDYNSRPQSSYGGSDMAMQLATGGDDRYGSARSRTGRSESRAMGLYDGGHQRSKSMADPTRQYSRDGRPMLHMARAIYSYQAAIPEELGFAKGDYLAVYRHQDDGWWEAEVHGSSGQDTLKDSARAITSKPVQRAVVNIVLLTAGAISLFCLAAVASALFFQNFVPDQFVKTPVHLQYGSSSHPYGIAPLPVSLLKSQQDYDISVTLSLPRSPANIERGNFMISLYLLSPSHADTLAATARKLANGQPALEEGAVVFQSRRPALFPYVDPVVSLASRVIFVFYHMLVRSTQTCTMNIPLAERVAFARDSTIPGAAYVEVEAGQGIQIYSVVLTMTAKLRGLRWLMFHYRLPTYLAFTSLFWACEFLFMSVAWTALSSVLGSSAGGMKLERGGEHGNDDSDDDDGSDDSSDDAKSFHLGRQTPVKGEVEAKKEEDYERSLSEIPMAGTEADDEDEDGETQGDSSAGARHAGTLRRRTSRHDRE